MRRRVLDAFADRTDIDPDELTVQTYHAFAASIVREHALLARARRRRRAARSRPAVAALRSRRSTTARSTSLEIGWVPTSSARLLTLNEEMQRHVVSTVATCAPGAAAHRADDDRATAAGGAAARRGLRGAEAGAERDRLRRPDRARRRAAARPPGGARAAARALPLRLPRRVPGHRRRPARAREAGRQQAPSSSARSATWTRASSAGAGRRSTTCSRSPTTSRARSSRRSRSTSAPGSGSSTSRTRSSTSSSARAASCASRSSRRDDAPEATIEAFVAPHQLDEADEIAERIAAGGEPWSQYAVLTRRQRSQFEPIFRALAARGVPVEVDVLGGFWTRPEILDVDRLAARARRSRRQPRARPPPARPRLPAQPARPVLPRRRAEGREPAPAATATATSSRTRSSTRSSSTTRSPSSPNEARERVDGLPRASGASWRGSRRRVTLADLVGEIARVTGLAAELAASPDPEAEIALRHLAKLRDLARDYQPVAGAPTSPASSPTSTRSRSPTRRRTSCARSERERRPADDPARRERPRMGRRLPRRASPKGMIRSEARADNPAERWWRLPFELRGDRDFLPRRDEGRPRAAARRGGAAPHVRRHHPRQAPARALARLVLRRQHQAEAPSTFWDEAPPDLVDMLESSTARRRTRTRSEPSRRLSRRGARSPLAPDPTSDRAHRARARAAARGSRRNRAATVWRPPSTLSVTAFLTFVRDPEEFFWRYVRRVPVAALAGRAARHRAAPPDRAARPRPRSPLGGVVDETEEPYDLDLGERRGDGKPVTRR